MGVKKYIPNVFTLCNLVLGSIAIVYLIEDVKPIYGAYCLVLALLFDFLDGFAARLLHVTSNIGKQLDSLADMVSFGLAPSVIAFKMVSFSFHAIAVQSGNIIWSLVGFSVFIMAAASAYRLARFNLDDSQNYSFKGLPTPANAMFWIGLLGAFEIGIIPSSIETWISQNPWPLLGLMLIMSWLLVSPIEMFSLKFASRNSKEFILPLVFFIVGMVLLLFFKWLALPLIVILYILISLIKSFVRT